MLWGQPEVEAPSLGRNTLLQPLNFTSKDQAVA